MSLRTQMRNGAESANMVWKANVNHISIGWVIGFVGQLFANLNKCSTGVQMEKVYDACQKTALALDNPTQEH